MPARLVTRVTIACLLALALAMPGAAPAAAVDPPAASQPNIVVFLLDDTNPVDGRLWNDPSMTPNIYQTFVAHGIDFSHAIDDTPLCCPSRATLLTGLHSFNHNVTVNDVRLFNPAESLAVELSGSGYQTMLVGKYMNHPEYLTGSLWNQHAAPWSVFDIFTSKYDAETGFFYDYTMQTKDGQVLQPEEHSTQLITERTVAHLAAADPSKPIYAELSIVDTHLPNIPMPGFESDPRWAECEAMAPWDPPNYNEADVSDKPGYVQKTVPLPYPDGFPMDTYCKEMLGVDWMVGQVTDELATEGRLDNTLLVFTADNGMGWGQHRLVLKDTPYATDVPLYMAWPARWGSAPRTIDEWTSNIDLAPTFCAAAGCSLGPFPTGQSKPDGVNLLPLIDGDIEDLGRDALLETEWRIHPWAAVQTTDLNDLGLWHYVEYQSGFRELYNVDPDEDPWEMDNLAYDPAYADIRHELSDRLTELLAEGRPNAPATVTIVQDSQPNNKQDFSFSGDLGTFVLDDDGDGTLPRKKVFSDVSPGTYVVAQAPVGAWKLFAIVCPPGSDLDLANGTAILHVHSGEQLTCTFRDARPRPDASIAIALDGPYKGEDKYNASPVKRQTLKRLGVPAGHTYDYFVSVGNDWVGSDSISVQSTPTGPASMSVAFFDGATDVTAAVLAGSYSTGPLQPGETRTLTVEVTIASDARVGDKSKVIIYARSEYTPSVVDVVRAVTTR